MHVTVKLERCALMSASHIRVLFLHRRVSHGVRGVFRYIILVDLCHVHGRGIEARLCFTLFVKRRRSLLHNFHLLR